MKFNIYILLSAALLWCMLFMAFAYRATWHKDRYLHHRGAVTDISIREYSKGNKKNTLCFTLSGLNDHMAIYKKEFSQYDTFTNHLFTGDTADLYFERWNLPEGSFNHQIVHLQKGTTIFIDHNKRKRMDTVLAIVFGCMTAGFLILAYVMHKRNNRPVQEQYTFTIA